MHAIDLCTRLTYFHLYCLPIHCNKTPCTRTWEVSVLLKSRQRRGIELSNSCTTTSTQACQWTNHHWFYQFLNPGTFCKILIEALEVGLYLPYICLHIYATRGTPSPKMLSFISSARKQPFDQLLV